MFNNVLFFFASSCYRRCVFACVGASLDLVFFSRFSENVGFFGGGGGKLLSMCFDFFYNLPETFLILRRNERDMIKNVHWSSCKVPINSCQILTKL